MLEQISYYLIFGRPLIMYLGIITLMSFIITATIGILYKKGLAKIPFKWHPRMAIASIILALVHGLLAIMSYL